MKRRTLLFIAFNVTLMLANNASATARVFEQRRDLIAQDNIRRDPYGNPLPPEEQPPKMQGGTQSTTLQSGTNSTTLQTGTKSTLLETGTKSTLLQTGAGSTLLNVGTNATKLETGTAGTLLQTGIERKIEPSNVLVLLDCSTTMKLDMEGKNVDAKGNPIVSPNGQDLLTKLPSEDDRLSAAKRTLKETLRLTPPDVKVGLRIFGNTSISQAPCQASYLLVPIGLHNRGEIIAKAEQLKPKGLTPLAYALKEAAADFEGLPGERHIILISDGGDTCKGDPCLFIKKLRELGFKMRVDVIGVDKKAKLAEAWQLECLAKESGGKFYEAETAAKLSDAMNQSVLEAIAENAADRAVAGQVMPKPLALKATPAQALQSLNRASVPIGKQK